MQLTTREAVEQAIYAVAYASEYSAIEKKDALNIAKVLCEHYGFKIEQFFDAEVVE